MKRILAATAAAALAVGVGLIGFAAPASATGNPEECTPREAYTQIITPAKPAVPAVEATPAVYETVAGDPIKWNWAGGPQEETPAAPPGEGWHKVGPTNDSKAAQTGVVHAGNGKGSWFFYEATTEQKLVSPEIPGTPGSPAVEAVTVDHPAVTCDGEEPPVEEPECVKVVWAMPEWLGAQQASWPQTILSATPADCGDLTPPVVPCDTQVQIDSYYDNETTDALVAGGVLYGPNNPRESLIPGGWGEAYTTQYGGDCPEVPEPETVTPLPPTFEDVCGTEKDAVNVPDDTDEYTYEANWVENVATVTATAEEGFIFDNGYGTQTWTFEFTNEECPVVVVPPTEEPPVVTPPVDEEETVVVAKRVALPETGAADNSFGFLASGIALLVGLALTIGAKVRRRA